MTLGNEEYRELARALLATCPEEIDCERWLEGVGTYLDLIEAGRPIPESLPPVKEHLRLCPDCAEEYATPANRRFHAHTRISPRRPF